MKLLALSPLLVLPLIAVTPAAVTPAGVYNTVTSLITSIVTVVTLLAGLWIAVGRPLRKRIDEERKEQVEEKRVRESRERTIDANFEEMKQTTAEWRAEYGRNVEENKAILDQLKATAVRHDSLLDTYGKQLEYLRGKDDARREIAENARAIGQVIDHVTHPGEEHPS